MDTTFSTLFYRWQCLLCPSDIRSLSHLFSCTSGTCNAVDRLCPLHIWDSKPWKGTVHICLWLQLNLLFKLHSFPWDGSNVHTVFHLASWAYFVGLDLNMLLCLNRLCLICCSLFLYWAVISSDVLDGSILSCLVQQQQSHALSREALLSHWVCQCGKEVKFSPATPLCWGCGFKMKS